ncbi:hypothetical protein [Polaromonas sp. UC242_47]|uniref:hypothetical protein n=1 Tax=Polaromonas sp. UC242_47 TaxID=3374626 RepID=UPI0037B20597
MRLPLRGLRRLRFKTILGLEYDKLPEMGFYGHFMRTCSFLAAFNRSTPFSRPWVAAKVGSVLLSDYRVSDPGLNPFAPGLRILNGPARAPTAVAFVLAVDTMTFWAPPLIQLERRT